jgi:hypothetical protein
VIVALTPWSLLAVRGAGIRDLPSAAVEEYLSRDSVGTSGTPEAAIELIPQVGELQRKGTVRAHRQVCQRWDLFERLPRMMLSQGDRRGGI